MKPTRKPSVSRKPPVSMRPSASPSISKKPIAKPSARPTRRLSHPRTPLLARRSALLKDPRLSRPRTPLQNPRLSHPIIRLPTRRSALLKDPLQNPPGSPLPVHLENPLESHLFVLLLRNLLEPKNDIQSIFLLVWKKSSLSIYTRMGFIYFYSV